MEYLKYLYALIYLILFIITIRLIFKKGEIHFKLLKEIFPETFVGIESFYNPILWFPLFSLDFKTIIWFTIPIYYQRKKFIENKSDKVTLYNKDLLLNNRRILIFFIIIILWLFGPIIIFQ